MTLATPDTARAEWPCPLARTFYDYQRTEGACCGDECPLWRWEPLSAADPRFVAAIKARMRETQESHQKAVKHVMDNRAELGLPTEPEVGFCGAGGRPVA